MALDLAELKRHLNITENTDNDLLTRTLAAAEAHLAAMIGAPIDDEDLFPDGTPADVEQAVLLTAAHWYENREGTLVGVIAQELPIGVRDIVANHRIYSYG